MNVHLYRRGERPEIDFRVEDLERAERQRRRHGGARGWIDRQVAHYKTSWHNSPHPAVQRLRRAWDWLHRRTAADEPFLAHLRAAGALEIGHDPAIDADEAARLWQGYLKHRGRRHGVWFALSVLVAPLCVLLTPLPGPNLIGYWFAYRALHHGLILSGLRRAKRGGIVVTFRKRDDASPRAAAQREGFDHDAEPAACGTGGLSNSSVP